MLRRSHVGIMIEYMYQPKQGNMYDLDLYLRALVVITEYTLAVRASVAWLIEAVASQTKCMGDEDIGECLLQNFCCPYS